MDRKLLQKFDYSICIASAAADGKFYGCAVNSLSPITSAVPQKFSLALSNNGATKKAIDAAGFVAVTVAGADCPDAVLNEFGYKSGRAIDKFSKFETFTDANGMPYLKEGMVVRLSFKVIDRVEVQTHTLYILELLEGESLGDGDVLTVRAWADRGKTVPPAAPIIRTLDKEVGWKCTICGYVYPGEELPPDYRCPICKAPASKFVKL